MARSCLSFGDLSFTLPYHSPCAPGNGQQRLLASGWYSRQLISRPRPALTNPASAPAPSATATRPMHVAHQPAGTPQMQGTIDRRIAYATATVIAPIWPVCPTNHRTLDCSITPGDHGSPASPSTQQHACGLVHWPRAVPQTVSNKQGCGFISRLRLPSLIQRATTQVSHGSACI